MKLEINEVQLDQMIACLDVAVKGGGMQAAIALHELWAKLMQLKKDGNNAGDTDAGV
jgi:hypothetical protein